MSEAPSEVERRQAIARAVAATAETYLFPDQYEWQLLTCYIQGEFSLDQVLLKLKTQVQHLLYRSQSTRLQREADLVALTEQAQRWNADHQISGVLCYCNDGHFVQLLEGEADQVHRLFEKIQQDKRHYNVQLMEDAPTLKRWFADWSMALVKSEPDEFYWLLGYLEAKGLNLVKPQVPITSPPLITMLKVFSRM